MKPTSPNHSPKAGFTLIELMVVISVIGLLSSIVLAALSSARVKGQESAVISELIQFRNLYELNSSGGSYSALQPQTIPDPLICTYYSTTPTNSGYKCTATSANDCATLFGASSPEVANNSSALSICKNIVNYTQNFSIGLATGASNQQYSTQYSMWAYLPSQKVYVCYGSSNGNSILPSGTFPTNGTGNTYPGCPANP